MKCHQNYQIKSAVFLLRQKWIVNFHVKKFVKDLSNENKQWCFCCLQDKTWIKMPILWKHFSITEILWRTFWRNIWQSIFDVVKILRYWVLYQIFMLAIGWKELTFVSGVVFLDMTLSKVHTCWGHLSHFCSVVYPTVMSRHFSIWNFY